jgi:hypothetical protein
MKVAGFGVQVPAIKNFKYQITNIKQITITKIDKLVKSRLFRHACEGRYPELFENTGFPPSRE